MLIERERERERDIHCICTCTWACPFLPLHTPDIGKSSKCWKSMGEQHKTDVAPEIPRISYLYDDFVDFLIFLLICLFFLFCGHPHMLIHAYILFQNLFTGFNSHGTCNGFLARVLTRVWGRGKTINTVYSTTRPKEINP